jgi:hypothetical protein
MRIYHRLGWHIDFRLLFSLFISVFSNLASLLIDYLGRYARVVDYLAVGLCPRCTTCRWIYFACERYWKARTKVMENWLYSLVITVTTLATTPDYQDCYKYLEWFYWSYTSMIKNLHKNQQIHQICHFIVMLSQVLLHVSAHQHHHQGAHTILASYLSVYITQK